MEPLLCSRDGGMQSSSRGDKSTCDLVLSYSSGTTGLQRRNADALNLVAKHPSDGRPEYFTENDTLICVRPLFHITGGRHPEILDSTTGATIVTMRASTSRSFWQPFEKYGGHWLISFPIVLASANTLLLITMNLTTLRTILCGAAPLGEK